MTENDRDGAALRRANEDWLRRWRTGNIGWHHEEYNPHLLGFWPEMGVPAGARIFVPLCGKSRDMAWLVEHGYSVVGVELSPLAVEMFFRERRVAPSSERLGRFERWQAGAYLLLCGDIFDLDTTILGSVDGVYDRASLVALDPEQRRVYARRMARLVPTGVRMLLVAMEYAQGAMQGPPYSVPQQEVEVLYGETFSVRLLHSLDLLKETPRYADRGLDSMVEKVYLLERL